jgi:uncharacterized protein (DUF2147 family)
MKTIATARALGALALLLFAVPALAQNTPVGTWRTIDDETGEPKSTVRIFEENGVLVGEIQQLLPAGRVCSPCARGFEGRNLQGERIITGLRRNGNRNEWSGGRITDPASGRTYSMTARMDGANRLILRGYVMGIRALGRSQTWERVR